MRKNALNLLRMILIISMIGLAAGLLHEVEKLQGNARVINYAGIVRGGTQRLIKEELHGKPDDRLMFRLDNIMRELAQGGQKYNIMPIRDKAFQAKLASQQAAWEDLKEAIRVYRLDKRTDAKLFALSEMYFEMADTTVAAAQEYSETLESHFSILRWLLVVIIIFSVLIVIVSGREMLQVARKNEQLKRIAYIDASTGLANQRKCRERLANKHPISPYIFITCCMFDLNNLKQINDKLGHDVGDQAIIAFGTALHQSSLPHMFVGRNGGDEFIAIGVNVSTPEMEAFLSRVQVNSQAIRLRDTVALSYASGCANSQEFPGLNIGELMEKADERMYADKTEYKRTHKCM